MEQLLLKKTFPLEYPKEAVRVLETMTFSNGRNIRLVGSASLKTQVYAGDYDAHEDVKLNFPSDAQALNHLVSKFQSIIRNLLALPHTHIGDIKAGVIEDWRIIPKTKYNFRSSTKKIETLLQSRIISSSEAKFALSLLKPKPKKIDLLKAHQDLKFHIVRWSPQEVLNGKKVLRNGMLYTLQSAFSSPTITKLDVIALIEGRYTEFSCIYSFFNNEKALNPEVIDPEKTLKDSILLYQAEKNPFKVLKRKFSLAKLKNNLPDLKKYHTIINSELGKLYVVYSDVRTLADLLEHHHIPSEEANQAISSFADRLAKIYGVENYLRGETKLLADLNTAIHTKNPVPYLRQVEERLLHHLNRETPT